MAKFYVEIVETLIRGIPVEAESAEEAEKMIEERYANGEIILDYSDFLDWEIVVSPEVGGADV